MARNGLSHLNRTATPHFNSQSDWEKGLGAMSKKIRFAALIRVSTEKQEKQGESLRTQRSQVQESVNQIGGTVAEWYGGQEHATEGWEKKELDRLLRDSIHQRFDAVIVA